MTKRGLAVAFLLAVAAILMTAPGAAADWVSRRISGTMVAGGDAASFIFAPDGKRVVYLADQETDGVFELFSTPTAGGAAAKLNGPLAPATRVNDWFLVSPDGKRVVYLAAQLPSGAQELYSVPVAGGAFTRLNGPLVPGGAVITPFIPTPDGGRIVYRADQETDGVFELYAVPTTGGPFTKLNAPLVPGRTVQSFSISPDGSRVVYTADQDTDEVYELYAVGITGGAVTKLAGGNVVMFKVSADGGRVVFQVSPTGEISSVPIGGGTPTRLSAPLRSGETIALFSLSPDGGHVVYYSNHDSTAMEIYCVPTAGGAVTKLNAPLTGGGNVYYQYQFTPDGSRVIYRADQNIGGVPELFSVQTGGGAVTRLNSPLAAGRRVVGFEISPDGQRVLFVADQDSAGVDELYAVPASGGAIVKINGPLVSGGDVVAGFVQGEQRFITSDGRRVIYRADQDADEVIEVYSAPITGGKASKVSGPMSAGRAVLTHRISPNSRHVVYSADQRTDEVYELFASHEEWTVRFSSRGGEDGWVLESSERGGRGGSLNRTATTLQVGDDALDRQYRSLLSFNTGALPNDAVAVSAVLRLRRAGIRGTDPFRTHGRLLVDLRVGAFSGRSGLQPGDFQAKASRTGAATVARTVVGGWHRATLGGTARALVNRKGLTQMRLRFARDDNDDRSPDVLRLYSGNAPAARRPVLEVRYRLP